jgi:pyruvate/2-oxoglutarate dehydrogenase complex dihydrolipoamide dehydrogenase (E3) component
MRSMSSAFDAVEEQTGAEVYLGHTRFAAPDVVEVDDRQLRFKKAVLATGASPLIPTIDGLKSGEYLTNESVFSLTELPSKLVVIRRDGGDFVAWREAGEAGDPGAASPASPSRSG